MHHSFIFYGQVSADRTVTIRNNFCKFDAVFGRIPHSNVDKLKDLEGAAGVAAAVAVAVARTRTRLK